MLHRAQEALARKLGTLPKVQPLTDNTLKEYITTFEARLPQDTIATLSRLFKMDCQLTSLADEALAELRGHCLTDSQETKATATTLPMPPQAPSAAQGALMAAA